MKILWICNARFSNDKIKATGSWLQPMAWGLATTNEIELANITFGDVNQIEKETIKGVTQYTIPRRKTSNYGQVPHKLTCTEIARCEADFQPDIVHIWGTENVWASVYAQGYLTTSKVLIDIQGLLGACTPYYMGGLSIKEILKSIHLKEVLMPHRNLFFKQRVFKKRGEVEKRCLQTFNKISTQSQWVREQVRVINPNAKIYDTKIMLRDEFYKAQAWVYHFDGKNPIVFSSCSGAVVYKGMHQLLKMLLVLKNKYPNIQLRLAGAMNIGNRLLDGYSVFLNQFIQKNNLTNNVVYLGPLSAGEIINELHQADVCVIPSFVETYCLALAEALMVGTPCVVSYTSALPETAIPDEEALFYNSQDYVMAAAKVDRLLLDKNLAEHLSAAAKKRRFIENNPAKVIETQMSIYKQIYSE